jgi:hypothetical protein
MCIATHYARLGTWLLARLYQGGYLKPRFPMNFQGATLLRTGRAELPHPAPDKHGLPSPSQILEH